MSSLDPSSATHIRPFSKELLDLCAGKLDEFRLLGYGEVKLEDVWSFVCAKMRADAPLHQWVDFILSIRVMDFMNYQTLAAYKGELE